MLMATPTSRGELVSSSASHPSARPRPSCRRSSGTSTPPAIENPGGGTRGGGSVADAADAGAEGLELAVDVLVAAVDLVDAADDRAALGAERGDDQRDPGADVGARDAERLPPQGARSMDEG